MDNFIKQISQRVQKPTKELSAPITQKHYNYAFITFNLSSFYYCNDKLFYKPENNLLNVSKSLLVMNSFPYEYLIIRESVYVVSKYGHIYDIYFLPVGWLLGYGPEVTQHVCIKTIIRKEQKDDIYASLTKYLLKYNINMDDVCIYLEEQQNVKINKYEIKNENYEPVCVISFYPFCPEEKILFVLYIGRYKDKYCGVSYLVKKDKLYEAINKIYYYVRRVYLVDDKIIDFRTIPLVNSHDVQKLPIRFCYSLCEMVYDFDKEPYIKVKTADVPLFVPHVPKQYVSIINLPTNVTIQCCCLGKLEYVTHINHKKLGKILIIIKDKFLKDVKLVGEFKKSNFIYRKKYVYTVTCSTFDCPSIKEKKKVGSVCNKLMFDGCNYTTRTFNDVI